jgi:hypothetical protein
VGGDFGVQSTLLPEVAESDRKNLLAAGQRGYSFGFTARRDESDTLDGILFQCSHESDWDISAKIPILFFPEFITESSRSQFDIIEDFLPEEYTHFAKVPNV